MQRSAGLYINFTACDRPELLNIKKVINKRKMWLQIDVHIQLTFTCSKSTIETLAKGVRYADVVLAFLLLTLIIFHIFL